MPGLRLITFPPSLDSEFARFVLGHYRVHYQEERHAFIFSSIAGLRHGSILFPLLYDDSMHLDTVHKIIAHYEAAAPPERQLLPEGVDRTQAETDWKTFHRTLSTATTVLAYYHLLPHREIMVGPLSEGAPPFEVRTVQRAYPVYAAILRGLLRLTKKREQQSIQTIREVLQTVGQRLEDRPFLLGDTFTLSDLNFAVAAAPVVWPQEYGGAVPAFDGLPPELRSVVKEMRSTRAGEFALQIYRDRRNVSA